MSEQNGSNFVACPAAETAILSGELDNVLSREWLITNRLGGYASSSVVNCNTRRYHGWLVAAMLPPVGRVLAVNNCLERLTVDGREFQLSNFEFNGAIHPDGYRYQTAFHRQIDEELQSVFFVYQVNDIVFMRTLCLFAEYNVALAHWLAIDSRAARPIKLSISPLLSMRDFHSLRRESVETPFVVEQTGQTIHVASSIDEADTQPCTLHMTPTGLSGPADAGFIVDPDWWYNFRYRVEAQRGQECGEDIYVPGHYELTGRGRVGFGLWLDAEGLGRKVLDDLLTRVNEHLQATHGPLMLLDDVSSPLSPAASSSRHNPLQEPVETTLRKAASQFIVDRKVSKNKTGSSILAGYHWFGDWGRDAFIALPGLLLSTGQYEDAQRILKTFGEAQKDGLIPNRFDDYGGEPAYNSIDASLWYVYAADEYLRATNDTESWRKFLKRTCQRVVDAFIDGTKFDTHIDENDGLLWAGNEETQLTWMDAKCGGKVFTPRWGKAVEINALWYNAVKILAERFADRKSQAAKYQALADKIGTNFRKAFWNADGRYLYDVVRGDFHDEAIRPNQIFAVSLRESPLTPDQRRAVVECVRKHLLTPYGLRSLAPSDEAYKGMCVGDQFQRDSAYHQGTVWAFLIGPFVEAFLKVGNYNAGDAMIAESFIKPLLDHLYEAGIGTISEIFDGNAPHHPRGCIAQAWSVAQLIQAFLAIKRCQKIDIPTPTNEPTAPKK